MKSIEKTGKIDRAKLSQEFYFQSLMEQGFELEMLSPAELERIQLESLTILTKQTGLYTKGSSSSIRVETAKDILASIMFTVGTLLKTFPLADDALTTIKNEKIESLYQQGFKRINSILRTAKVTHSAILRGLFETRNVFYNDTVVDAIGGFFRVYEPAFGAHKIHITADYPVYIPLKPSAGIEFILNYLEKISLENSFCLRFPPDAAHRVLCGYAEGYEEMVINIYEPLLTTAAGCALSGSDPQLLNLTAADIKSLERLFAGKNSRAVRVIISGAFKKIQETFSFHPGVKQYMDNSLPLITSSIEIAMENQTLKRLFIKPCKL